MSLKTIVLYGPSQCGKTHCLNYLADKLIKGNRLKLLEKKSNGNGLDDSENHYTMLFDTEGKEVLVIVTTQSDYEHAEEVNFGFVEKYMDFFPDNDFFWFTASRTKGKTTTSIENKTQEAELYWICKGYVNSSEPLSTTKELYKYSDTHIAESFFEIFNHLITKQEDIHES